MPGIGRQILSMPFQQDLDDRCNAFETWPRDKLFCFSCGGGPKFGAQISYPKHTWSSVKIDHQIVNFGCRRIKEYSGHTDSRGCGVSGNMCPSGNDRCDIFRIVVVTSWLRKFVQPCVFQWEPIRQVLNDIHQGISLWFASGG